MEFISSVELACGKEAEKTFLPMQPGDVYQTNADTSKLEDAVGFKPNKDIYEGVQETVDWYKQFYK